MKNQPLIFTDFAVRSERVQLDKLRKLCVAAGIKDIDMDGKSCSN